MRQRHFREKPVWVTGGAGFIGSHLAEALVESGAAVTVLDNLSAGTWDNLAGVSGQIESIEGDIRDSRFVEGLIKTSPPQVVFHLAANASVPGSVEAPAYDFQANCLGTFTLLEVLRHYSPGTRVILASSAAVYGNPQTLPITEATPLQPISPYGASKVCAEVQGRMFHSVYGIPVVIARIFNTYGPRMPRFVILDFLKKLKKNPHRLEILGDGTQLRDFNFIGDTVQGLMLLGHSGLTGDAYNIASGLSCSVDSLAQTLLTALRLNHTPEIIHTHQSWVGDAQAWSVAIDKMRRIGYDPRISLEDGIKIMIKWFETT